MFDETDPNDPNEPPVMSYRWSQIRRDAWYLARHIKDGGPPSRARSLALTSLEQAVLWAEEAETQ